MPHRYMRIKQSMKAQHPNWPERKVTQVAAKTYEKTRQPKEMHLATAAKRERDRKTSHPRHRS